MYDISGTKHDDIKEPRRPAAVGYLVATSKFLGIMEAVIAQLHNIMHCHGMRGVCSCVFLFFAFLVFLGWGPGINGLLTRERDSETKIVKTDETS